MEQEIGSYVKDIESLSLKESILRKDNDLAEGYYCKEMTIKQDCPVDYQVFYAQLAQVAINAREVLRNIAGSPAVRESGECIAGIYTPEGHSVVLSQGVLLHVYSMTEVIRFMALNDYEQNPGIREGDFFFNNDPHCGGQHSQDQFVITPVYYQGSLVAWVGGMSHEMETGATGPGGYDPEATSRYYEGLFMSPTKIAHNDILHNDFKITVEHGTRDATYWLMDTQAKMSACIFMRNEIQALIGKWGLEFFSAAMEEIIQDGMTATLEKIRRRFIPGTYRARNFADALVPNKLSKILQTNIEITVDKDGHLIINLEGCSAEQPWPGNGTIAATKATLYCALAQILTYDCKFNAGSYFALQPYIPAGSVYACGMQAGTSKYIGNMGASLSSTIFDVVSRMNYASGYLEEVVAGSTGGVAIPIAGVDALDRRFGGLFMEAVVKGSGGRALQDGENTHGIYFNPIVDMGDIEIVERSIAVKYLARQHRPDSGGLGKFRAGASAEHTVMVHKGKNVIVNIGGLDYRLATCQGLMGGYPSPKAVVSIATGTDLKERFEQKKPYPVCLGTTGKTELEKYLTGNLAINVPTAYPNTQMSNYDVVQAAHDSCGGFGDPLERDPKLIIDDIKNRITTLEAAKRVYGVILEQSGALPQDISFNQAKTESLRKQMRNQRKEKGVPAAKYVEVQKERLVKGDIPKVCAAMINELIVFSPKWGEWFKKQWGLPADFRQIPIPLTQATKK